MSKFIAGLLLASLSVTLAGLSPAAAQTPTSPPPTVLDGDAPIETIVADPDGKAVIEAELPNLIGHPAYEQFKALSLRQLEPYSGGAITPEKIEKVEAGLKAAKAAKQ